MKPASSWGRLTALPHEMIHLNNLSSTPDLLATYSPGLAYGMGRSYGDVCLNPNGILWNTTGLDRFIHFDDTTGTLSCEAGVLLCDISRLMLPRGWGLPVTPGTQLVTLGGVIANDVHGKNHHRQGSFGCHVLWLKLIRTNGEIIECGPQLRPEWFAATLGGVGLTGVILAATIKLRRISGPWLTTQTIPYANLTEFLHLADTSEALWEHTVAWVDCLSKGDSRGLFMRANPTEEIGHRPLHKRKLTVPFIPPFSLINRLSLRAFNATYFHLKKRQRDNRIVHYESFFYPLDNLHQWNRLYGSNGFFQYQSVVPRANGQDAIQAMLNEISKLGNGSFLAVLKTFGNRQSIGMMSFPIPGITLALDFSNKGTQTLNLFKRLDDIVREAGGRIYLAKDARMPRELFEAGYPRLNEFLNYRDPGICSALSRRLIGDPGHPKRSEAL